MGQHRKTRKKRPINNTSRVYPDESEFKLPPEDDNGNIEYKSQLIDPTVSRLQHLVTQMKWRLCEGNGEAIYKLGVFDDGTVQGLNRNDLSKTMQSIYKITQEAGASLFILNDRCVYGKPSDPDCRRVVEVLVKKIPAQQSFVDIRIALLGSAFCGKSTLCGVLTQGTLDNGHGKSRLNFLRYLHEIRSGKTSSITIDCFGFSHTGELLNYKENDLKSILERSAKLISLIDLAGDHKFLKTTIYGLSGYSPDYAAILVNPRIGWNEMSDEHLTIAHAFDLPIFVIISKIDLVGAERIEKILQQIQMAIDKSHKKMQIQHVLTEDATVQAVQSIGLILPVFSLSNVTGENLNLLTKFLNLLPNRNAASAGSDEHPVFYIDETFNLSESGLVLCGIVGSGSFDEADQVHIGPDSSGNYRMATIKSIRRNKQPVLKVHAGETASVLIEFTTNKAGFNIKKGMVVVSNHDFGVCCQKFRARFRLISHSSDEIYVGFQGVAYIGSLRRAVTITEIDCGSIRHNEWATVIFTFFGGPAFVQVGSRIFFREQNTKGIGEIIEIPDS